MHTNLPCNYSKNQFLKGFTLAELLIALAILGVIATFTIPKVLQSQQSQKSKAITKEVAAMISNAFELYKMDNSIASTMSAADLTPYMNYVRTDSTSTLDDTPNASTASIGCTSAVSTFCLRLHSGGVLRVANVTFSGTDTTNAVWFMLDPDGQFGNGTTADGPSKSINIYLYTTGRIATYATIMTGTVSSDSTRNPNANRDPSWFSWN